MKFVLLSGGSGKRLWPLSNDSRSKQFLKVLKNEDGKLESMVQRVWRQLSAAGLADAAYLATGKGQLDTIYSQLGAGAPVIVEPERRDTFPAIALAATYLYAMEGVGLDEIVAVLPVDPYVDQRFFHKIAELESVLAVSGADMALIGVMPTYPSEKYGYILTRDNPEPSADGSPARSASYADVHRFIEKPGESEAKRLIEQDALWNCGVFAFRLGYLIDLLIERELPIQYEEFVKRYPQLPSISFDYEVVEKAKHVVVSAYDGYWKDLGTWNTLTEEVSVPVIGKGIVSDDSVNSHIVNELEIPVMVIGLPNVVVASSPDGILVADKSCSARIKEVMKNIEQRPMYEERRWGWYKVLDFSQLSEQFQVLTKRIHMTQGKNSSYQLHHKRSEAWTVLTGEGELMLNEKLIPVKAGDIIQIPVRARHSIRALTDLDFIEVQSGSELVEEDTVRLFMDWDEIAQFMNR